MSAAAFFFSVSAAAAAFFAALSVPAIALLLVSAPAFAYFAESDAAFFASAFVVESRTSESATTRSYMKNEWPIE